jgi:response regulator RpfG family c-di-GMP phosphodiesterase
MKITAGSLMETLKILWIDEDVDEFEMLNKALQMYTAEISCKYAINCDIAFQVLREEHIDIIFLDFNMPPQNGYECLKKISEAVSLQYVPVYIFSASTAPNLIKELCLQEGAKGWITKPRSVKGYYNLFDSICNTLSV